MKKKQAKKLTLAKETVRRLNSVDLQPVDGGTYADTPPPDTLHACPTRDCALIA